uniref:Uncharacterized protein n=1 Tax=Alexandrium monilatum TaxID=311494 RepID=A0A6T0VAI0_9DINO
MVRALRRSSCGIAPMRPRGAAPVAQRGARASGRHRPPVALLAVLARLGTGPIQCAGVRCAGAGPARPGSTAPLWARRARLPLRVPEAPRSARSEGEPGPGEGALEAERAARERLAYERLEGTPVSRMASGLGKEGAGALYSALAVMFVVLCALTAAVVSGAI